MSLEFVDFFTTDLYFNKEKLQLQKKRQERRRSKRPVQSLEFFSYLWVILHSLFSSNNRVTPLIQQAQEMESRLMPKARDAGEERWIQKG
jgi:hypothetical protein